MEYRGRDEAWWPVWRAARERRLGWQAQRSRGAHLSPPPQLAKLRLPAFPDGRFIFSSRARYLGSSPSTFSSNGWFREGMLGSCSSYICSRMSSALSTSPA